MTRFGLRLLLMAGLILSAGLPGLQAASPSAAPDFKEVYDLIRSHLPGMDAEELNRTSVQALVSALSPRVMLIEGKSEAALPADAPMLAKSILFEGPILYLRLARVEDGLAGVMHEVFMQYAATNKLKGLILDLRFAGGEDYAAAAAGADLFLAKERSLLDWGKGPVRSKEKSDPIAVPVAVLVNRQTSGSAEALAAVLRETGLALILGARTAGQATIAQDYPLANGARLRIAVASIQLGDGTALPAEGFKPDILVQVTPTDERAYFLDAFKGFPKANAGSSNDLAAAASSGLGTNRARRPRLNEAELVRGRKEGFNLDPDAAADGAGESDMPTVRDPVLARALDVLRGLAVVRQRP